MDADEIRLRIVEVVVPHSHRVGMMKPEHIEAACLQLEKYVVGSDLQGEKPTTSGERKPVSPNKPKNKNKPRQG